MGGSILDNLILIVSKNTMLDTWLWSEEHRQLCKVIETQTLWGNTFCRIWLPNQDTPTKKPDKKWQ
ncbi:hypothetical protein CAL7716_029620 [Calothrix sp. PCC 7716]|nr:hypothetical protein CAL7716_029620 [Calothrix sp. PCC 7716]